MGIEAADGDARPSPEDRLERGREQLQLCGEPAFSSDRGTSRSARWLVASATFTRGPSISISTSRPNASASSSVWPMKRTPARVICSLDTGAVHSASSSPRRAASTAAVT